MPQANPFGGAAAGPAVTTGPLSPLTPLPPFEMPPTAQKGSFMGMFRPSVEEVQSQNVAAFRAEVLKRTSKGQDVSTAVLTVLETPAGQAAIADPAFPKNQSDFLELISPEGPEKGVVVPGPARLASPTTGKVLLDAAPDKPQSGILLVNEIMKETASLAPGETSNSRLKLLHTLLPRDATNEISFTFAMKMRAAGLKVPSTSPFANFNEHTPEEATRVLNAGQDERSATDNDLIEEAVSGTPDEKKHARSVLKVKVQMRAKEMDSLMALIMMKAPPGAQAAMRDKNPQSLDELFDVMDGAEAGEKTPKGGEFKVPVEGQKPGEAKGATTLPGTAGARVGDTAGQAETPILDVKGIIRAIKSLSPEDLQALRDTLGGK